MGVRVQSAHVLIPYDMYDAHASKVATIIPLIKDAGRDGDMDYLQWDTISLMSLLNVYVIVAYL